MGASLYHNTELLVCRLYKSFPVVDFHSVIGQQNKYSESIISIRNTRLSVRESRPNSKHQLLARPALQNKTKNLTSLFHRKRTNRELEIESHLLLKSFTNLAML